MKYRIFGRKLKHKYHLINPATGNSWCRAENNKQLHEPRDSDKTEGRKLCHLCSVQSVESDCYAEPSLAVLMGEAVAVEESEVEVKCRIRDAGRFLTVERDGRIWTLGKQYPQFEEAKRELMQP